MCFDPCSNDEFPDSAPAYGCAATTDLPNCALRQNAGAFWNAFEGEINQGSNSYAAYTCQLLTNQPYDMFERFEFAYLSVTLDQAYNDITAVDFWFLQGQAWALAGQANISVWLSNTRTYNAGNASYQCVNSFTPTVYAPARTRIPCAQTLNATRYVTVWRRLAGTATYSDTLCECRLNRVCVCAECRG